MSGNEMKRRDFLRQGTAVGTAAVGMNILPDMVMGKESATTGKKKIRVGIIGCGSVCRPYVGSILACPDLIEIVSFCDIIVQRAQAYRERHGVLDSYPNIDEMLAGVEFDLLLNLTNHQSHYEINKAALNAGKNVWTEKPMALTVEGGKELIALAKEKNLGFWPAPIPVITPQFQFMAENIAAGKIGKVVGAQATFGQPRPPRWGEWYVEKGGEALFGLGVYDVTALTGLLGPATEVVGMADIANPSHKYPDGAGGEKVVKAEAYDNTMLMMRHASGAFSHVYSGYCCAGYRSAPVDGEIRHHHTVHITGETGNMLLRGYVANPKCVDVAMKHGACLESYCEEGAPSWASGACCVAKCMLTGKKSLITAEHGLHALEIMCACLKSHETGRRISLETTFDWPIIKA